jgi:hypothetical protein
VVVDHEDVEPVLVLELLEFVGVDVEVYEYQPVHVLEFFVILLCQVVAPVCGHRDDVRWSSSGSAQ